MQYAEEERHIREENLRLQRKLQMEIERREQLCRHLSESESSLEMDDERYLFPLFVQSFIHYEDLYDTYLKLLLWSTGDSSLTLKRAVLR